MMTNRNPSGSHHATTSRNSINASSTLHSFFKPAKPSQEKANVSLTTAPSSTSGSKIISEQSPVGLTGAGPSGSRKRARVDDLSDNNIHGLAVGISAVDDMDVDADGGAAKAGMVNNGDDDEGLWEDDEMDAIMANIPSGEPAISPSTPPCSKAPLTRSRFVSPRKPKQTIATSPSGVKYRTVATAANLKQKSAQPVGKKSGNGKDKSGFNIQELMASLLENSNVTLAGTPHNEVAFGLNGMDILTRNRSAIALEGIFGELKEANKRERAKHNLDGPQTDLV